MSEPPVTPVEQCLLVGYYDVVSSLLSVRYSAAITIQTSYRRHLQRLAKKAAALDNQMRKDRRTETADLSLKATLKASSVPCSLSSAFAEKNAERTSLKLSVVGSADVNCSHDKASQTAGLTEVIDVMVEQDATQTAEKHGKFVTCERLEASGLSNGINELAEEGVFESSGLSAKASALAEQEDKALQPTLQQLPALVVRGRWIRIVEAAKTHMLAHLREARGPKIDKSPALVRGLNNTQQTAVGNSPLNLLKKVKRVSKAHTNKHQHSSVCPLHFPNSPKLTTPSVSSSELAKLAVVCKASGPPIFSQLIANETTAGTAERCSSYTFISPHARASRRPRVKMRGSTAC
jgi:hypothetical protein